MADARNILVPGIGLRLTEKQADFLGSAISDRIDDQERQSEQLFDDIRIWWDWYEAKPRFKQKDFPFKGASNLIVPLIQYQTEALVNRLTAMVFGQGQRIWMARTQNTEFERQAVDVARFLNWAANGNDFDFRTPVSDWLTEVIALGSGVMAINWRDTIRMVMARQRQSGTMQLQPVNFGRGVLFEHVPREQILWNTQFSVAEAPMVTREFHLRWSDLIHAASSQPETGWIEDNVKDVQKHEGLEGPSQSVGQSKDTADSRARSLHESPHDIREVCIDFPAIRRLQSDMELPLPGEEDFGTPSVELVFTIHRNTRKLLRARVQPYNLPHKPFFDGFYKKRPGRGHSVGLCKKLEHMQNGMTVLLNQAIDSRTRANTFWAKTSVRKLVDQVIDPRHPVYVPQGQDFEALNLDKNVLQETSLFNIVNIIAERLTGQADPALGRESRQGGHPSPATSTLALLAQSDEMISTLRMMVRQRVSSMGEAAATLYQQYEANEDGRLTRILGAEDAGRVEEFLFPTEPLSGLIAFDLTGMSQTQNPQQEVSRNIQLAQMNVNYWSFVAQVTQQIFQARQSGDPELFKLVSNMARTAIKAQTRFQERLLEAGNVDDIEDFVLAINREVRSDQRQLLQLADQLGGAGEAQGVPGQLPLGNTEPLATGGALFAPGALSRRG